MEQTRKTVAWEAMDELVWGPEVASSTSGARSAPLWVLRKAHRRAAAIVERMTLDERSALLLGIGWKKGVLEKWWYVGNTARCHREDWNSGVCCTRL